jgi:hypothetical protein
LCFKKKGKMRKIIFLVIIYFLTVNALYSQTVFVGSTSSTHQTENAPIYANNSYSWSSNIYSSTEIQQAGNINKLSFFVTNKPTNCNINIPFKLYIREKITSYYSDNWSIQQPDINNFNLVYTGSISWSAGQWNEITFDNNFFYSNTNNLEILLVDDTNDNTCGSWGDYLSFKSETWKPSGCSWGCDSRTISGNSSSNSNSSGSNRTERPIIKLDYLANTPYSVDTVLVEQPGSTKTINIGSKDVELLKVNIKINGALGSSIKLNNLAFNFNGTDNINNVSKVKIYTGGSNSSLSNAIVIDSLINPTYTSNVFTINSIVLNTGNNYFFLTIDAALDINAISNEIDAEIIAAIFSNGTNTIFNSTNGSAIGSILLQLDPIEINPNNAGCGSSVNGIVPASYGTNTWGEGKSWSASIYDKSYFSSPSTLEAVSYFIDCGSCTGTIATNQKIYLGHTTINQFSNNQRADLDTAITDLTLVYSGNVNWVDGVWNEIELDTEFEYDKTKNIVVYFENEHNDELSGGFSCSDISTIVHSFGSSSSSYTKYAYDGMGLPNIGNTSNQAPIIKFKYKPSETAVTLPIELVDFYSNSNDYQVTLYWQTLTEINNEYFEIEKSKDGKNFHSIAKIKGNGSTTNLSPYKFSYNETEKGCHYYRLKQVDFDGGFWYSDIIYECTNSLMQNNFRIYPNPINFDYQQLKIANINGTQNLKQNAITITDIQGKVVFIIEDYEEEIILDLEKGIYFINIERNTKKLIIK